MKSILLPLFILVSLTANAQSIDTQKLDNYFEALDAQQKFMGTVAIFQHGRFTYTHSVGYTDVAAERKADNNSRYRIGSISKTFTSTLVMMAVEEGKLKLDDQLNQYFPEVKNSDAITLRQMLHHQSGIANFTSVADYDTWNTRPHTKAEMLSKIYAFDTDFEPGSNTEYSNSNYILLGYILEKVYDREYADFLNARIIQPLSLNRTSFGGSVHVELNECRSYSFKSNWELENDTDMSIPGGAGAIVSTAQDLASFIHGLFHGKLVSETSLKEMTTLTEEFGFGLYEMPYKDQKGYGHGGAIDGFISQWHYLPDSDQVCVMTSNGIDYSNKEIFNTLLAAAQGEEFDIPTFTSYAVSPEELQSYPGHYVKEDFPLEIDVRAENGQLSVQATGQPAFPLHPSAQHQFREDRIGVLLIFRPDLNEMELQQGGQTIVFTKDGAGE